MTIISGVTSDVENYRTPGPQYLVAGRYRLKSRIGGGGMGTVWLARDQLLDRDVAAKQVLSTEGLSEDTADNIRQRAMREGRIAARLSHRNAIAMHDVALDRGEPWLVMEYLPSRSIAQILHANETLSVPEAAKIGAQVADAMVEAHASGIVHRDIKPGNILVAGEGRNAGLVKLTDFGISRAKDDVTLTQTGVITGTPAYFAPEVARGADPSEASDVYSLGATIYTMVEGQPPFGLDDNSLVLLHRVARARINPMTKAGSLHPVLLRMLEPSPTKRLSMTESRDRLAKVAASGHTTAEHVLTSNLATARGDAPAWISPRSVRSQPSGSYRPVTGSNRPGEAPRPGGAPQPLDGPNTWPAPRSGPSTPAYAPTQSQARPPFGQQTPGVFPSGPHAFGSQASGPQASGPHTSGQHTQPQPPQRSGNSPGTLALAILAFFIVLAGVIVLAIALMR